MFPTSRANTHVRELLHAADVTIKNGDTVRIVIEKRTVGTGATVVDAVLAALATSELAQVRAQTLLAAAALSLGPTNLLEAFMTLWGDDEDEDDEDDDEDDEDEDEYEDEEDDDEEEDVTVRFRRRG